MPVPSFDQFIEPLLRYLAEQTAEVRARDAHEAVADRLGLTQEERREVVSSGQLTYKNRIGWAHDRLKRDGLSTSPRRGYWFLTEKGREFARKNSGALSSDEIERLAYSNVHRTVREAEESEQLDIVGVSGENLELQSILSPEEQIDKALEEIRVAVAHDVLERLLQVSPTYFETVVLDLLHKMGYGTSRKDLQRVGGSQDAGIDGIISLDKLGLEKVYVQAKRWQSSVGRPEIQAFFGALIGQRAKKGVFLTTSTFTKQACDYANSVEGIILVDGLRLADLMIEHEVGVTLKQLFRPELDDDYFEE